MFITVCFVCFTCIILTHEFVFFVSHSPIIIRNGSFISSWVRYTYKWCFAHVGRERTESGNMSVLINIFGDVCYLSCLFLMHIYFVVLHLDLIYISMLVDSKESAYSRSKASSLGVWSCIPICWLLQGHN